MDKVQIDKLDNCPKCGTQWKGEDIFQYFLNKSNEPDNYYSGKTEEEIVEVASHYGYTKEKPVYWNKLIGVETDDYDGVSIWRCPECNSEWCRWTNKELKNKG